VEFRILGPLEVSGDSGRLSVGGEKQCLLLASLLLEANHSVLVSRLVEAVWEGDEAPTTAVQQVRKMVWDLRRRLGEGGRIEADRGGYRLVVSDDQLDLRRFELLLGLAEGAEAAGLPGDAVAHLRSALGLWRGPALSGLESTVIAPACSRLDERRLVATEWLVDLRLGLGESRGLVAELQALVTEFPLRESLRCQLMTALFRSGRQAEALGLFSEGREILAEELGIDPGARLTQLHARILTSDPELYGPEREQPGAAAPASRTPAAAPVPSLAMLPYDVSDFTGRTQEIARVLRSRAAVPDNALTLMAVDGMAGVGKTTFALHVAHLLAADFPDGQFFLDLHGYTEIRGPVPPMEALDMLLRSVGLTGEQIPDDLAGRSALWRTQAAGRRILLLLDNVVDVAQIRPLLPGAGGCLVLVTSRSLITGLDGAISVPLGLMTRVDAKELLENIVGEERLRDEAAAVAELAEVCGFLPLAIRIAGARLKNRPTWTVSHLVRRLRGEGRLLEELSADDRSVAAAIGLSYRGLPPAHQRLFRFLALTFAGDFSVWVAAATAGMSRDETETILEDLVDARLLHQPKQDRYGLHDLVRGYARRMGQEDSEEVRQEAFARLLSYYLYAAEAADTHIQLGRDRLPIPVEPPASGWQYVADQRAALAWFDEEQHGLLAAAGYVVEHGLAAHTGHFPRVLAGYLQFRGQLCEHIDLFRAGVEAGVSLGDRTLEGVNLVVLSSAEWQLGHFRAALENMHRVLAVAEESGNRPRVGVCLSRIGLLCESTGRYREALAYLERAIVIHRVEGNRFEENVALISIAFVTTMLGNPAQAKKLAQQALNAHRSLGHQIYVATALDNLALASIELGEYGEAAAHLTEALEIAREFGFLAEEATALTRFADAHRRQGRLEEAGDCARRAIELLQTVKRPAVDAEVSNILGAVHRERGELDEALTRHRHALEVAGRIECRIELARAHTGIGEVLQTRGELRAANDHRRIAAEHHEEMGTACPVGAAEPCGPFGDGSIAV
jgi:DNA-binding SARP family transcriptional activator/tetratricopeptide (TPR) repeat protein